MMNIMACEKVKLSAISNDECLLVEFVNDEDSVETGFTTWIDEADKADLDNIIKEQREIRIFWPDVNISSAATLQKSLKKANFEQHPVKILAKGTWSDIRKKQKNILKFNMMNPNKEERKSISKKPCDDDETSKKVEKAKSVKGNKSSGRNSVLLNTVKNKYPSILSRDIDYNATDTDEAETADSIKSDNEENKLEFSILEEDEGIQKLQIKNKELAKRVQEIEEKAKHFEIENYAIKIEFEDFKEKCANNHSNNVNIEKSLVKTILSDLSKIKDITECSLKNLQAENHSPMKALNNLTNRDQPTTINVKKRSGDNTEMDYTNMNNQPGCSHWSDDGPLLKKVQKTNTKSYSGSTAIFEINPQILRNARSDTIGNYVKDLLDSLFSPEELAASSVTGKSCNANKDLDPRPPLNPAKFEAIEDKVYTKFGNNNKSRTTLRYVAKNKCGAKRYLLKKNNRTRTNEKENYGRQKDGRDTPVTNDANNSEVDDK